MFNRYPSASPARFPLLPVLAVLWLLLQSCLMAAPTGKITGLIRDSQNQNPLVGANAYIEGTAYGAATDLDGVFIILNVPVGDYQLSIEYLGYEKQVLPVTVNEGQTTRLEVPLTFKTIEGEVVNVTAQAEGQISAINQQLASNTIANVVSEARIEELPDVNAAESVGRLPGVAINRTGGEATTISIRGLAPKYNTVTVNGVRVPATGADDRSVDLSLISSNMLNGIEVKKAITPDMDADALGGVVDLKLKEAPSGLKVEGTAQGGYNQLQDYYKNYNFNARISNRFYDDKLGVIASFNTDEYNRSADKFSGEYRTKNASDGSGDIFIVATNVGLREESLLRGRSGASFLMDYRLPQGKVTGNAFYNRLGSDFSLRANRLNTSENRHYYDIEDTENTTSIFTGALGLEQQFDHFGYNAVLSRSATRFKEPERYTWQFRQEAGAYTSTDTDENTHPREIPLLATNDTSRTALAEAFLWDSRREEDQTAFKLDLNMPFNLGSSVKGVLRTGSKFRWLDRSNDVNQRGRDGLLYGNTSGPNELLSHLDGAYPDWNVEELVDTYGLLPITIFLDNYRRNDFLGGEYPLGFTTNKDMLFMVTKTLQDSGDFLDYSIGSLSQDYVGEERFWASYLMAELDLGKKWTLIPGFRYESDRSDYTGHSFREVSLNNTQGPPADLDTITNVRKNDFFLPMVHLRYRATDQVQIRLAYTESLTRPDYNQYAPITQINVFQTYIRAANGLLKPAHSTNLDASVSLYQNHVGLFTVSGFHKKIDDLIFQTNYQFRLGVPVPEGLNIPESWLRNTAPSADLYINNPYETTYKGVELDWQTHFWYLPSFLSGLILNVNYTLIDAETTTPIYLTKQDSLIFPRPPVYSYKVVDSSRVSSMPNQPRHIANMTVGYDFKGFSARLSWLYNTDKLQFIDRRGSELDNFSGAYSRWDLSLQQKVTKHLQFYANFSNLNKREDRNFRGDALEDPTYLEYYGFTMDFGARLRF
ncbi:MAG TPA: TonB-dependent receptor [Calditrichia bacterium]|nr:TonB-dependent receptor [Calditrichota bacterium]HQU70641.1 TonB-dependent receptor [Calditrichia bacterium]HQV30754.1 TonB-dependent receptor [Calditrichia bacterium]